MSSRRKISMVARRRKIEWSRNVTSWGVGPVSLDIDMAVRHGWSDEQIDRATRVLSKFSRVESGIAHRRGPVAGCPCVTCDPSIATADLPEEYQPRRESWRRRGLWPVRPPQQPITPTGEGSR